MRQTLLLFQILFATSLPAQSLDDYLRTALENNPGVLARQTEYQAALQKKRQVKALPDPTVNVSAFLRPMMLPMGNQLGSISAMQMFPWFGSLEAMENEAASMADVKALGIAVSQNELAYRVKSAWYPLVDLEARLRILRDLQNVLEIDKRQATALFAQGLAPMVDPIRADIMLEEIVTEIALLEEKRRPLTIAFNRLLNRSDTATIRIPDRLPEPTSVPADRNDSSLALNPALAVIDGQIRAAAAETESAAFLRKPMIGAGIQYMPLVRRSGDNPGGLPNEGGHMIMPMVSVSIPIWRSKYDAAVEEQRLMQKMYAEMKLDMANELAAMHEMTLFELDRSVRMIILLDAQIEKTQQAVDLLLAAYSNDGQDFDAILRLQREWFGYRLTRITELTNYHLIQAKLDYLEGNME